MLPRHGVPGRDRQHVENGAATVAGENRGEGSNHGQRAEVVGLHGGPDACQISGDEVASRRVGRVVDEHVDIHGTGGGRSDRRLVSDVEGNHLDPGDVHEFRPPRAGVNLGSPAEQFVREVPPDAPVCPGDQCRSAMQVHESSHVD